MIKHEGNLYKPDRYLPDIKWIHYIGFYEILDDVPQVCACCIQCISKTTPMAVTKFKDYLRITQTIIKI